MANILKIEGKTGTSYKITVTHGRDMKGKQMHHYLTWTPPAKMTQFQTEKQLNIVTVEFERKILDGFAVDNRQTFAVYAQYAITLKERAGAKLRTIERYRDLLVRINQAIGHLRLVDIRPQHLNSFYANLGERGVRMGSEKAVAKANIPAILKEKKITRARLSELAKIAPTTVTTATQGRKISKAVADAIALPWGWMPDPCLSLKQMTSR